jgi:hypothetical protein
MYAMQYAGAVATGYRSVRVEQLLHVHLDSRSQLPVRHMAHAACTITLGDDYTCTAMTQLLNYYIRRLERRLGCIIIIMLPIKP